MASPTGAPVVKTTSEKQVTTISSSPGKNVFIVELQSFECRAGDSVCFKALSGIYNSADVLSCTELFVFEGEEWVILD